MLADPDRHDRFGGNLSDGVGLEAMRLLSSVGKIEAIKYVREKKGLGLAQAKAYVEALGTGRNPDDAARSVPATTSRGCASILAFLVLAAAAIVWWLAR